MIHNEGRLNHLLLAELLEEQIDDITLLMALLKYNIVLSCDCLCFLVSFNSVEINAGVFLNCIDHGDALERLGHINHSAVIADDRASADFLSQVAEHTLGQFHHALIVGVCLIQLHQGKFRVVTGINTLVTEYTANLVNTL